jgi:phosphatidate cytidylyltransferase
LALVGGTFLAGNVGDLLLSVLKRALGFKDFSQLLPGHGGIFDRIDSLVCAAPVYLLIWRWLLDSSGA